MNWLKGPATIWYWNQYFYRWGQVDSNPQELAVVIHLNEDCSFWVAFAWRKGPLNSFFQSYNRRWDTGMFAGYRVWRPEIFFNLPWFKDANL